LTEDVCTKLLTPTDRTPLSSVSEGSLKGLRPVSNRNIAILAALSSAAFLLCGLVPLVSYLMTYSFPLCVTTNWRGIFRHRGLEDRMVRGRAGRGRG
jgi:hypothetical protein